MLRVACSLVASLIAPSCSTTAKQYHNKAVHKLVLLATAGGGGLLSGGQPNSTLLQQSTRMMNQ
jgi:hypothetical protein